LNRFIITTPPATLYQARLALKTVACRGTMPTPMIWYFIKFFAEESHADQFMAGGLHLNTLAYFKEVESESSDGRMDSTEAVAMWWQPDDLVMNLTVLEIGDVEITKEDLAGPVSTSFGGHNYLHLFACMPSTRQGLI
jgi:hypothetical protein